MSLISSRTLWETYEETITPYLDEPRAATDIAELAHIRTSYVRLALTYASSRGLVRETYQKQKNHRNPVPLYDNPLRVDQFKKEPFTIL